MDIFFPNKKKKDISGDNTNEAGSSTNSDTVQNAGSTLNNISNGLKGAVQNTNDGLNNNGLGVQNGLNAIGNMADAIRIMANTVYVEGPGTGNIQDSAPSQIDMPKEAGESNSDDPVSGGGFDLFGMLTNLFTNLFSGIGNFFGSIFGFAEGGSPGTINSRGRISGPGTGTSDNILAWVSPGEWIVKAETVRKVGPRFMERLNSGEIYNLHIPIPKYARGGAIGAVGSRSASKGIEMFSQDIGMNVSPKINVNNYVDGQRVFDAYGKPLIRSEARKEYIENMKMYSQLNKRIR